MWCAMMAQMWIMQQRRHFKYQVRESDLSCLSSFNEPMSSYKWTYLFSLFVCFDTWHPSQQFFSHVGMIIVFLGWTSAKQPINCLAQGHNTVTPPEINLKLSTLRSSVLRSNNQTWGQILWKEFKYITITLTYQWLQLHYNYRTCRN